MVPMPIEVTEWGRQPKKQDEQSGEHLPTRPLFSVCSRQGLSAQGSCKKETTL
jgi:hypothetical protein